MATLFIRDFPPELLRALKVKAAQEDKTLKAVCIEILSKEVGKSRKK
jgi:plasmid stability protein